MSEVSDIIPRGEFDSRAAHIKCGYDLKPHHVVRFMSRVLVPDNPDACWQWQGRKDPRGYGQFDVRKLTFGAHRVSYEIANGPIPRGLYLDHLCRNPGCVNPRHLDPVTHQENVHRGVGFTAVNAVVTHCPQGHPYSGDNLMMYQGRRYCRACGRNYKRAYKKKTREQVRLKREAETDA